MRQLASFIVFTIICLDGFCQNFNNDTTLLSKYDITETVIHSKLPNGNRYLEKRIIYRNDYKTVLTLKYSHDSIKYVSKSLTKHFNEKTHSYRYWYRNEWHHFDTIHWSFDSSFVRNDKVHMTMERNDTVFGEFYYSSYNKHKVVKRTSDTKAKVYKAKFKNRKNSIHKYYNNGKKTSQIKVKRDYADNKLIYESIKQKTPSSTQFDEYTISYHENGLIKLVNHLTRGWVFEYSYK